MSAETSSTPSTTPTPPRTAGAKAAADVCSLIRARNPLILVVSREEARAERGLFGAIEAAGYEARTWDCARGLADRAGRALDENLTEPVAALDALRRTGSRQVWIFRDLSGWLRDPAIVRTVRSLVREIGSTPRDSARAMILLSPSADLPPELAAHASVIDWPLPDRAEIAEILGVALSSLPDDRRAGAAPNGVADAAVDAAVGLTEEEARGCYARSLVASLRIDPVTVAAEKRRVIARERVLEWIDPIPGGLDAVGGLELLKAWLVARRAAFSAKARAYGLPAPKGVLLVGVPGCGKSLTAKVVPTAYGMPLLRLDMGALRGKFVGESEGNLRRALKVAETMAPCVVWLDEIEKALAGATQGAADGGVSADALGTILSWMQDRQGSVFVVATANDVKALPPELLRKGRFDEVWFVDLPTATERAAVLRAALRAHGRTTDGIDVTAVASATEQFTGSEIAALVPEALFAGFADGARPITTGDLLTAARSVVPLAKTAAEKIDAIRTWAKSRARPASTTDVAPAATAARTLDL